MWVVPGFKQLHRFAKGFYKTNYGQKDQVGTVPLGLVQSGTESLPPPPPLQHQIAELQRQYDLLRQTSASLSKCHSKTLKECEVKGESLGQSLSLSVYLSDIYYFATTDRWGNAGGWQVFSSRG